MRLQLRAPQLLVASHRIETFSSGESVLDEWLKRRALNNQQCVASRTFVVADDNGEVYGFYALAAGAITHQLASGAIRRNMPDPVPVLVLGRLAVDRRAQGIKLGGALLHDAVKRALVVAENTGVRAIIVHALHDKASAFYQRYGFMNSPIDPLVLMLRLNQAPQRSQ